MEKVGRNDPCPCGSGKKFKKCCESKMIGKKFFATKIDSSSLPGRINKAFNVSSALNPPKEEKVEKSESSQSVESVKEEPVAKTRTYTHKEKKKPEA